MRLFDRKRIGARVHRVLGHLRPLDASVEILVRRECAQVVGKHGAFGQK